MPTISEIKKSALSKLKDNWITAIFACLTLIFSVLICYILSELTSLFLPHYLTLLFLCLSILFICCPLFLGVLKFFWNLCEGTCQLPSSVFQYFTSCNLYFKSVKLFIFMFLKALPIILAFHLPAIAVWVISNSFTFEFFDIATPLWASNLEYILNSLNIAGGIATIFYLIRYHLAPVLLIADNSMEHFEALNMSAVISKKTNIDFIYLCLCFFGWGILSLFIIPLLFTAPYFLMCYILHVKYSVEEYNKYVERSIQLESPTFTAGAFYEEHF